MRGHQNEVTGEGLKDTDRMRLVNIPVRYIHSKHHHTSGRSRICEFRNYGVGSYLRSYTAEIVTGNRYSK
jgi:hypothetical protein